MHCRDTGTQSFPWQWVSLDLDKPFWRPISVAPFCKPLSKPDYGNVEQAKGSSLHPQQFVWHVATLCQHCPEYRCRSLFFFSLCFSSIPHLHSLQQQDIWYGILFTCSSWIPHWQDLWNQADLHRPWWMKELKQTKSTDYSAQMLKYLHGSVELTKLSELSYWYHITSHTERCVALA